jgi:adenylate cyclase
MKFTYIVLLLALPLSVYARKQGQARIDSLLTELPAAKDDTNKVKLLNDLAINFSAIKPDSGILFGEQALKLAQALDWKTGIARAYSVLGTNYTVKSDYRKALEYDFTSLKISEENGNKYGIAAVTNNIGLYYQGQGNYALALEYYFKSLAINEEMGYKNYKAANLSNIGEVYEAQGDYAKALKYDSLALQLFDTLDSKNGVANQLQNIGNVYAAIGNYEAALSCYFKAWKLNEGTGNKSGIAICMVRIGSAYVGEKKYKDALDHFQKALQLNEELGNKNGVATSMGKIGEFYLELATDSTAQKIYGRGSKPANLQKAISYLVKAIEGCKEVVDLDDMRKFSKSLSIAYTESGNYKAALESYMDYTAIKDSIFSSANKVRIINLETEREMGLKDKQIEIDRLAVEKKRNERAFFIAGIALLMLVIVFVLRNYRTQKRSNELLSVEKKRSDDLLLNILPSDVAGELKNTGSTPAKYFDNVTVLFTDFVNFTAAGEKMSPDELIGELHNCFKVFDDITGRHNIEKIKTIGDAYLAVAGLPAPDTSHAQHAVAAAIEINQYMVERKQQLKDKTFEVRIGIHSGSVVAGIVGVKKFAYDIWGDTVNTASRMEENSLPGKINISQTTYELVKNNFGCVYRGEIDAKNKGRLKMYFVEGTTM